MAGAPLTFCSGVFSGKVMLKIRMPLSEEPAKYATTLFRVYQKLLLDSAIGQGDGNIKLVLQAFAGILMIHV